MNDLPLPGKSESESPHRPKDVATRTPGERLQALWNEPLFQDALKAYRRLAKEGCDIGVVLDYVGKVAGYESGNLGRLGLQIPTGQEISRNIRAISRQLTKLAHRVAELRGIWEFWAHMVDAEALYVPEELQNIAGRLSCVCTEGVGEWFLQRDAIIDLLEHVRTATGRPHYAEVSLLINAELIWRATKNGRTIPDMVFDPDSLKMIVKRHKRRQAASVKKRSEMKQKAKRIKSMEYSPEHIFGIDPLN